MNKNAYQYCVALLSIMLWFNWTETLLWLVDQEINWSRYKELREIVKWNNMVMKSEMKRVQKCIKPNLKSTKCKNQSCSDYSGPYFGFGILKSDEIFKIEIFCRQEHHIDQLSLTEVTSWDGSTKTFFSKDMEKINHRRRISTRIVFILSVRLYFTFKSNLLIVISEIPLDTISAYMVINMLNCFPETSGPFWSTTFHYTHPRKVKDNICTYQQIFTWYDIYSVTIMFS